jgi:predicted RNase H-like HicB family nuclease
VNGVATLTCNLHLPAVFTREDEWVVACFPHLDVTSQGRTQDEAARNLIEAAQLFIESCFERNVLDEVVKNCGFVPGHTLPTPQATDGSLQHLTVPFELLAAGHGPATAPC